MEADYLPKNMYILKTGPFAKKSLSSLFLTHYFFLKQLLGIIKKEDKGKEEESLLFKQLQWIVKILKKIQPVALCTICKSNTAKYFMTQTIGETTYINENHICCSDCRDELLKKAKIGKAMITPLSFESLERFYHYNWKKRRLVPGPTMNKVKKVFRKAFEIKKMSPKYLFEWLKEKTDTEDIDFSKFPIDIEGKGKQQIIRF